MKRSVFRQLPSLLHLYTAAIEQRPVLVFLRGELMSSGVIERILPNQTFDDVTEDIIEIRGERFIRDVHSFAYVE